MKVVWKRESSIVIVLLLLWLGMSIRRKRLSGFYQISSEKTEIFIITHLIPQSTCGKRMFFSPGSTDYTIKT